jgi:hypothetical protein
MLSNNRYGLHVGAPCSDRHLDKAAALECGFISDKHLPDILAVGRSSPKKTGKAKAEPSLQEL